MLITRLVIVTVLGLLTLTLNILVEGKSYHWRLLMIMCTLLLIITAEIAYIQVDNLSSVTVPKRYVPVGTIYRDDGTGMIDTLYKSEP